MSNKKIEKLTPEPETLIPVYLDKWKNIALSTERIDREKAKEAVKEAYILIGLDVPEIIFYESPKAALEKVVGEIYPDTHEWTPYIQLFDEFMKMEVDIEYTVSYQIKNKLTKLIQSQILQLIRRLEGLIEADLWLKFEHKQSYMWDYLQDLRNWHSAIAFI